MASYRRLITVVDLGFRVRMSMLGGETTSFWPLWRAHTLVDRNLKGADVDEDVWRVKKSLVTRKRARVRLDVRGSIDK